MPLRIQPSAPACPRRPWLFARRAASARLAGMAVCAMLATACGKKGPPLAPLQRIPAKVSAWEVGRSDDAVFLTLTVPTANVGGDQPADVAGVEVYAVTSEGLPPTLEGSRVPADLALVTSAPVRRPVPPPPPAKEGAPPIPELPRGPGLDQGAVVTFRELLTPELATAGAVLPGAEPDSSAALTADASTADPRPRLSLPVAFTPTTSSVRRHYVAVAVSRRGRRGAWSDWKSVPVGPTSGAPSAPMLTYDEKAIAASWTPARDARQAAPVPLDGALESRPFGPALPVTRYNVYAAKPAPPPVAVAPLPTVVTRPAPLNEAPLATPHFAVPGAVTFGAERCLVVRPVDTIAGVDVEGPASPAGCATPRDTFAPTAPAALEAVAGAGVISLIWDAVEAPDLAGYLVFRGPAPGAPETLLTPEPIAATSFEDRSVVAGVRYVYVVVAVDSATPVNRSVPSNRVEETARP